MDLTSFKKELEVNTDYTKLDDKSWEEKIHLRDIDVKFDDGIDDLIPMYTKKISDIRYQLREGSTINISVHNKDGKRKSDSEVYKEYIEQADSQWLATEKQDRLYDKLACCLKEQKLRKSGLVTRTPHHTTYYVDWDNGNDANDGLSADNTHAWKTISKYTSVTVRTAGDNAYVRANQTHSVAADIVFDEDGTIDAYLSIIGCDATTNDPWNDDSNNRPVIDFGDAAYSCIFSGDNYWWLENLDIRQSSADSLYFSTCIGCYVKNCIIQDNVNSNCVKVRAANPTFESCTFKDTGTASLCSFYYIGGIATFISCIFDGGAVRGADSAIDKTSYGSGYAYFTDCSFGETVNFSTAVFSGSYGDVYYLLNCTYSGTLLAAGSQFTIFCEDCDGVYGSAATHMPNGTITKETASPRSGGSASYAKMLSTAYCGPNYPLETKLRPVELTASIEKTITVYARVGSAWDSALSASEAFMKVSYLSNASTAARTKVQSTQTITNDGEWTAFTVTITPLQTGLAYVTFYLAEYEDATEYIDVDDIPVAN